MVLGAEAESQAEGSPVASAPDQVLANMYQARGDRDAEAVLLAIASPASTTPTMSGRSGFSSAAPS